MTKPTTEAVTQKLTAQLEAKISQLLQFYDPHYLSELADCVRVLDYLERHVDTPETEPTP